MPLKLWRYCTNTFIIIIFLARQHKATGRKTRLDIQNYGNDNLLCDHGVVKRNHISSLQSRGKALEKECCLLGVFCDSGDMPANLLCELNGYLMPLLLLLLLLISKAWHVLTRNHTVLSVTHMIIHMWIDHTCLYFPAALRSVLFPIPLRVGGWVDLGGLATYLSGMPTEDGHPF